MDNRELENRIKSACDGIAPDILGSVLSDCDAQKGQIIVMQNQKKKASLGARFLSLAAAFALICTGAVGMRAYSSNHTVASTIMLDVNPSLEIRVNQNEKVLNVTALNKDAKIVVGDMDFSGSSLDVTINALIGSMLRNGYISDAANSILITVDSNDAAAGQALQTKLMSEIQTLLESGNVSGALLGQTVTDDRDIRELAQQYGITVGKARLIRQITQQHSLYTFEDLVSLTINDLNLISESSGTKLESVTSIGTASAAAYIGNQAAIKAALRHAGIEQNNARIIKCEMDWENGRMVYEVDFGAAGYEYEYEINAKTGDIIRFEKESEREPSILQVEGQTTSQPAETPSPASPNYLSEATVKSIIFKHAGVKESEVYGFSCKLENEDGVAVYEIEFHAKGYEYDYDVHALTGEIVTSSREADDDAPPLNRPTPVQQKEEETDSPAVSKATIGEAKAKASAFSHAGVNERDILDFECELENENGRAIYEIKFDCNGYEYDYEIDAATGAVLKHEKDLD
jgi:uncharacterized membrane protein YkoI